MDTSWGSTTSSGHCSIKRDLCPLCFCIFVNTPGITVSASENLHNGLG